MPVDENSPKVSLTIRVLAWIVVISLGIAAIGAIVGLIIGNHTGLPTSWGVALIAIVALLTIYPVMVYIAFTGRPPKWWKSFDEFADITKPYPPKKQRARKLD